MAPYPFCNYPILAISPLVKIPFLNKFIAASHLLPKMVLLLYHSII
uniref:Uncharacterized protein n=1 Tax=Arundo donax TaxID=35708 RepID=A0A0A9HE98_ARUDO